MIYPPKEDSLLLEKWVKRLARGKVLDMGTGSGIQAVAASKRKSVKSVLAVDINPAVVRHCRKNIASKKISCLQSDLFAKVKGEFDTIVFNPPYLPQELPERDVALEGGKKGCETIVRFLESANAFLETNGIILLLFSSLSNKKRIEQSLKENLFDFEELDRLHIFFEDLFVYKIIKSKLLRRIEKAGAKQLKYFARGKRSWVFKGKYKGKDCVVKVKRPDSVANAPAKEGKMLRVVNKLGLGPRLFLASKDFVVYEYVPGNYLEEVLAGATTKAKKRLFRQLFMQAFVLDNAGLAKEEMLRPLKNAIVTPRGKVVMIDFERTHRTKKPHNVTQLCTFAAQQGIAPLADIKYWAIHYKHNPGKERFRRLLKGICL
ncbi:MAG: methyltransferase [Candidatus Woesearchaeota archaeon]